MAMSLNLITVIVFFYLVLKDFFFNYTRLLATCICYDDAVIVFVPFPYYFTTTSAKSVVSGLCFLCFRGRPTCFG